MDTGATANPVCLSWLARLRRILERHGIPRVTAKPAQARFRLGDGRLGEGRQAYIAAGVAGDKGVLTAFATEGGISALSRKGALEAPVGQLDCSRGLLRTERGRR